LTEGKASSNVSNRLIGIKNKSDLNQWWKWYNDLATGTVCYLMPDFFTCLTMEHPT
jgi:hypothetical protein